MWRAPKPVIAQVHGWCVGGGSDTALCADLVIASEDARIGTPYARMWGCYLSGLWLYRLGLTKAKEYALTGKPLSGREAADVGVINRAVPFAELEATVRHLAQQLASIPSSQLAAMKLIVNQAYENMGLNSTQILGPILDGLMRNTPDAIDFIHRAEQEGVRAVITARDGPFRDYSQGDADERPNPNHVIRIDAEQALRAAQLAHIMHSSAGGRVTLAGAWYALRRSGHANCKSVDVPAPTGTAASGFFYRCCLQATGSSAIFHSGDPF